MIPLALVAGFLGAGKTTFLKDLVRRLKGRRILFLVNEFAEEDIDAVLIGEAGGMARAVSGGSVFCVCKADEFKERLIEAAADAAAEGVVVEASGMAEPRAMGRILSDPRIAGAYSLASLTALIDPATFPKLVHTLPAVRGQAADADYLVVNKCDTADAGALAGLRRLLAGINPGAKVAETTMARTDLDIFAPARTPGKGLEAELTGCGDRSFASLLASFAGPLPLADFERAIRDLGGFVTRVKGWLNTPDRGRLFLDLAAGGNLAAQSAAAGPSRLVVIVKGDARQAALNRLSSLPGCAVRE